MVDTSDLQEIACIVSEDEMEIMQMQEGLVASLSMRHNLDCVGSSLPQVFQQRETLKLCVSLSQPSDTIQDLPIGYMVRRWLNNVLIL